MKKFLSSKTVLLFAGFACFTSCSLTKHLDDMNSATQDMDKSTTQMNVKTGQLADKMDLTNDKITATNDKLTATMASTNALQETMSDLHAEAREGTSMDYRLDLIKLMKESSNQVEKIAQASKYFMAFEFQLARATGGDSDARLEELYTDAITEFTANIESMIADKMSTSPNSHNDDMEGLYAMAFAVDSVNHRSLSLSISDSSTPVSMLSLIEESLTHANDLAKGTITWDSLLPHQQLALVHQDSLVYLLQIRANFIPAVVLSKISQLGHGGAIKRTWTEIKAALGQWTPDLSKVTIAQLYAYSSLMIKVAETRGYLEQIGLDSKIDCGLQGVFKNMKPLITNSATLEADQLRQGAVAGFQAVMDKFTNTPQTGC